VIPTVKGDLLPAAPTGGTGRPAQRRRAVATLAAAGEAPEVIAHRLDLSVRHVRRLIADARREGGLTYISPAPEQVIGREMALGDALTATLLRNLQRAEAAGDHRAIQAYIREIRQLRAAGVAMLSASGWFETHKFQPAPQVETTDEVRHRRFNDGLDRALRAFGHATDDDEPRPVEDD
jgi:PAS domain-containing protein